MIRRLFRRRPLGLPITLGLTLLLSLLPLRWLRWTDDLAGIVSLPLIPLRAGASSAVAWLRPGPSANPIDDDDSLETLAGERDAWRLRAQNAELRIKELSEQVAQLQQWPVDLDLARAPARRVHALVTGRDPSAPGGVPLEVNRGSRHGIVEGAIAVSGGLYLVGRVTKVGAIRSVVTPVINERAGFVRGLVVNDETDGLSADNPVLQLEAVGDGTLVGEVPRGAIIEPGDVVVVDDPGWPIFAQGMIVGVVESSKPKDEQPLRHRVIVRPPYRLDGLGRLVLVGDDLEDAL